jgi:hypothetical protein
MLLQHLPLHAATFACSVTTAWAAALHTAAAVAFEYRFHLWQAATVQQWLLTVPMQFTQWLPQEVQPIPQQQLCHSVITPAQLFGLF